jgi:hypothetical protein
MIHFERGIGVKEALGIGEFTEVSKKFKEFFEKLLDGSFQSGVWSNFASPQKVITQVEPAHMWFKNQPDRGGGNVNKFYAHMVLNDFSNYGGLKEHVRTYHSQIERFASESGKDLKIVSLNFYIGPKYFKKAGLKYQTNSILVEIVYSKKD